MTTIRGKNENQKFINCMLDGNGGGAAGVARAAEVTMFVRHEVADFAGWKKSYDAFATSRSSTIFTALKKPRHLPPQHS
jgi:hypothetical protein